MYRLQVKVSKDWKWGIVEYDSLEKAEARVDELRAVGIMARVKESRELFN